MLRRSVIAILAILFAASPIHAQDVKPAGPTTKEVLTDAAVVALLIAASIAAYKSMGRPCACPDDVTAKGRRCGGNSAYLRAGGHKPHCYAHDITSAMIEEYRKGGALK